MLEPVMRGGRRLAEARVTLEDARRHAAAQLEMLPDACRRLEAGPPAYPVEPSEALRHKMEALRETLKESS